ncbi:MAG: DUF6602 domain-containing protein [Fusobacteriaceae bacterium]
MSAIHTFIMEEIRNLRTQSTSRSVIRHQGIKGASNEELFKELLLKIIPSNYKIITQSIIQDSYGNQSNEVDIIIYQDDFLPPFFLSDTSGFIPIECVKYAIEVKTTLTSEELKTTIDKFSNLNSLNNPGSLSTLLFAFNSDLSTGDLARKTELQRLLEIDDTFFYSSPLSIMCVLEKEYVYLDYSKHFLNSLSSKEDYMLRTTGVIKEFEKDSKLIINGINYDSIYYMRHNWRGTFQSDTMDCLLLLLIGISNTLCKKTVGNYLGNPSNIMELVDFSYFFTDLWGNKSPKIVNYMKGIDPSCNITFNFSSSEDGENHLIFEKV